MLTHSVTIETVSVINGMMIRPLHVGFYVTYLSRKLDYMSSILEIFLPAPSTFRVWCFKLFSSCVGSTFGHTFVLLLPLATTCIERLTYLSQFVWRRFSFAYSSYRSVSLKMPLVPTEEGVVKTKNRGLSKILRRSNTVSDENCSTSQRSKQPLRKHASQSLDELVRCAICLEQLRRPTMVCFG